MSNGAYKFAGRVVAVGKTELLGRDPNRQFKKRVLVVDDADKGSKYPNPVQFEATGDKCSLLDSCRKGDLVEVKFYLNGREWKDKFGVTRYFVANHIVEVSQTGSSEDECPENSRESKQEIGDAPVDDLPF